MRNRQAWTEHVTGKKTGGGSNARKFRNTPTISAGISFASKAEARRYDELMLLVHAGEIKELQLQPRFDLVVHGLKVGRYQADFSYRRTADDTPVIEDVKGYRDKRSPAYRLFRLKAEIIRATLGITVMEIF